MALVSLKIDNSGVEAYEPSPYGCGTTIYLTEEQVEALGLAANPPKAGTVVGIKAFAIVQSVTQQVDGDAEESGESSAVDVSMRLQLTDMEVTAGSSQDQSASLLYG
jgi:hypothetical protein